MTKIIDILASRENEECIVPSKRDGDAGYDIYIDPVWFREKYGVGHIIEPHETVILSTGIRTAFENTHYAQIQERGSTGVKAMKYGAGVFDSIFRGIWQIIITNSSNKGIYLCADDTAPIPSDCVIYPISKAVAQFVMIEVPKAKITEVSPSDILAIPSERGEGMLGASGK